MLTVLTTVLSWGASRATSCKKCSRGNVGDHSCSTPSLTFPGNLMVLAADFFSCGHFFIPRIRVCLRVSWTCLCYSEKFRTLYPSPLPAPCDLLITLTSSPVLRVLVLKFQVIGYFNLQAGCPSCRCCSNSAWSVQRVWQKSAALDDLSKLKVHKYAAQHLDMLPSMWHSKKLRTFVHHIDMKELPHSRSSVNA